MSDYTPTTEIIRRALAFPRERLGEPRPIKPEAFDRWLDQTLRDAKAETWEEGHLASDTAWDHIYFGHPVSEGGICPECSAGNPYRQETES